MTLQEISDRLELQDLLTAYSYAIDTGDWDALDKIFTPDAVIDYTEMGGVKGGLSEIKAFLGQVMGGFSRYQHMVATSQLTIEGDVAHGRTICHNPMVLGPDDGDPVMLCGLWYRDRFVRTPEGWRIAERYEEKSYMHTLRRSDGR